MRNKFALILIGILFSTSPLFLSACQLGDYIYTEDGAIECGADGDPIILDNNPEGVNPTFDRLMAFLNADTTDTNSYIDDVYVCADFSEDVHNNAEAAGIRAGWVGIKFENMESGHALNVFETTDRGLVYIDCTNGASLDPENGGKGWDMVAYVEEGQRYGVIHVDDILASGFDYYPLQYRYYADREAAWVEYSAALEQYNAEVRSYNEEISGKTFIIGSPEYREITQWELEILQSEKTLKKYKAEYGSNWYESEYSSYTVTEILIHWD
ncbi:MAG: hypothetical protein MUO19_07675 [Dehalococcoidales bacterium]|nr:hypothetical protein [Dehalococcoidales bacterium]